MKKTLYIWDIAGTLFREVWNKKLSGFTSFDDYIESLGYNRNTISPRDYEEAYRIPYSQGLFNLIPAKGLIEILQWARHNIYFTTGVHEQIDWRDIQLREKNGFIIKPFFEKSYSTFDFGDTNEKTAEMLVRIFREKYKEGFTDFVYTDDKKGNCLFYLKALEQAGQLDMNITGRAYRVLNNNQDFLPESDHLSVVGDLSEVGTQEEKIRK